MYLFKEMPAWGPLATFIPNKCLPVYNWLYYKEGFARDLVFKMLEKFHVEKGSMVLDPFCGSGTTLLACREKSIDSIGFDTHPVALFAATVKTRSYEKEVLRKALDGMMSRGFRKPQMPGLSPLVRRAFNTHTLDDVIFFRNEIMSLEDSEIRDFFMLGLMNVAMKCSYAWKDGAVIKIRKHPVPPLRKLLKRQLIRMIKDAGKVQKSECKTLVQAGDARRMNIPEDSIDAVITSPPYLNKIEYANIYTIEEELFFEKRDVAYLRSFIGVRDEKIMDEQKKLDPFIDTSNLPVAAIAYFSDMLEVIKELHRVCREGARLAVVVGNGCFPEGVVDSDVVLSQMAEKLGFRANEIIVLNKRWCTRNRVEKVGMTRESLLVWEK